MLIRFNHVNFTQTAIPFFASDWTDRTDWVKGLCMWLNALTDLDEAAMSPISDDLGSHCPETRTSFRDG